MNVADFSAVAIADGVAVLDVSAALPRHPSKRYRRRTKPIRRIYVHHSGAAGEAGIAGAENCADYTIHAREWPGIPYTYWLPEAPLIDAAGRLLVLQTQQRSIVSFHTAGLNDEGIGVALQGNKTRRPLTESQNQCLDALLAWLVDSALLPDLDKRYPVAWHSIAELLGGRSKPSCPGAYATAWLKSWLEARGLKVPEARA